MFDVEAALYKMTATRWNNRVRAGQNWGKTAVYSNFQFPSRIVHRILLISTVMRLKEAPMRDKSTSLSIWMRSSSTVAEVFLASAASSHLVWIDLTTSAHRNICMMTFYSMLCYRLIKRKTILAKARGKVWFDIIYLAKHEFPFKCLVFFNVLG